MSEFHLWQLLAGLGLFLFGMQQLEQGLKGLTSDSLKIFLRDQTRNPLMGVLTGTIATAVMQSSSVVGLIVLAFVGAGILQLRHALGIIFGSNLGTTVTGWLVAYIGFKLDLDALALPMLAVGSLSYIAAKVNTRIFYGGSLIFGVGLLLFGLGNMKSSVEVLAGLADVQAIAGLNLVVFLLAGCLFTAIIQSSSAAMVIILSALHGGIIDLPSAAALVIGADLGTTSTLLLGGMRGIAEKKRVAMAHFLFNLITDTLAFLLLKPLLALLQRLIGVDDPLFVLVGFHSSFNLLGIMLFLPFVRYLSDYLNGLFKQPEHIACVFVPKVPEHLTDTAIEAAFKAADDEVQRLLLKTLLFLGRSFKLSEQELLPESLFSQFQLAEREGHKAYDESYTELKEIEGELIAYIYRVQNHTSDPEESRYLSQLHHLVRICVFAAKNIKDIRQNLVDFRHADDAVTTGLYAQLSQTVKTFIHQYIQLQAMENLPAFREKLAEVEQALQAGYEQRNQLIFTGEHLATLGDIQLASLAHVNRTVLAALQQWLTTVNIFSHVTQAQNHSRMLGFSSQV